MTQHSQNGEGMEAIDRLLRFAQSPEATIGEHDDILTVVALARQSLAREPATADVGREAIEAGNVVLEGRGNGTYAEAEDAIRKLLAALSRAAPSSEQQDVGQVRQYVASRCDEAERQGRASISININVLRYLIPSSEPAIAEGERERIARVIYRDAPDTNPQDKHRSVAWDYASPHSQARAYRLADAIIAERATTPPTSNDVIPADEQIEKAARYVLDNSRRGNASLNSDQYDADTQKLMTAYRDIIGKALASGFLATTPPTTNDAIPAGWKLVPFEPRLDQLIAGNAMWHRKETPLNIYRTMVSAAPKAPAETGGADQRLVERIRAAVTYQYMPMAVRKLLSEAASALSAAPSAPATEAGEEAPTWRFGYPDGIPGTPEYEPPARVCIKCGTVLSRCACQSTPTDQVKDGKGGGA